MTTISTPFYSESGSSIEAPPILDFSSNSVDNLATIMAEKNDEFKIEKCPPKITGLEEEEANSYELV